MVLGVSSLISHNWTYRPRKHAQKQTKKIILIENHVKKNRNREVKMTHNLRIVLSNFLVLLYKKNPVVAYNVA